MVAQSYHPQHCGSLRKEEHNFKACLGNLVRCCLKRVSQVWWYMPIIQHPGGLKQKDPKFQANLDNSEAIKARPCLKI